MPRMHRSLAGGRTESIRTSTTAMLPREPDTSQTLLGHFPDASRTLPKHIPRRTSSSRTSSSPPRRCLSPPPPRGSPLDASRPSCPAAGGPGGCGGHRARLAADGLPRGAHRAAAAGAVRRGPKVRAALRLWRGVRLRGECVERLPARDDAHLPHGRGGRVQRAHHLPQAAALRLARRLLRRRLQRLPPERRRRPAHTPRRLSAHKQLHRRKGGDQRLDPRGAVEEGVRACRRQLIAL
mmetsp:Transcript_14966/g.50390  ORF Transcript_14966/g.50390 Transcript_14966/m.50390 type:complete len:238 (-) Transcript_14966:211-924(-)